MGDRLRSCFAAEVWVLQKLSDAAAITSLDPIVSRCLWRPMLKELRLVGKRAGTSRAAQARFFVAFWGVLSLSPCPASS